jgi:ABC-2 type transport system permease protein
MTGFYPVLRKEMANFFLSPIAYVVLAIFLLLYGIFFSAHILFLNMQSLRASGHPMMVQGLNVTDMVIRPVAQNIGVVLLLVMPLITMRLFSEEKKSGTIELLLTYPISDLGVLMGKYAAAMLLLVIMFGSTAPMVLITYGLGAPDSGVVLGTYLGLLLMGGAFIAMGMFISSLTENQIVSAAATFGLALLSWLVSWFSNFASEPVATVIRQTSILEHVDALNKGIISLSDLTFFILFAVFFLFMTARSLETHRWRG